MYKWYINMGLSIVPKKKNSNTSKIIISKFFSFSPHLIFNNLILVSDEEVFGTDDESDQLTNAFLPHR